MAEDHGAPEAGQLLMARTRGRRVTESRQKARGAKSLAGQSKMKKVSWVE